MNAKLANIIETASANLRSEYAREVLQGRQMWSGSDLKGNAKKYGSSYYQQRQKAGAALREAGGQIIATESGRLMTAVSVCVDDYGNQIFATTAGYAAPHKSNYRHLS